MLYIILTLCILNINFHLINSNSNRCNSKYYCNECSYTKKNDSYYYYELFCKDSNNKLIYSSQFKDDYIKYFKKDSDINSFCGKEIYSIKNMNLRNINEIILFNSKNKNFNSNKYMHCHYIIDLEKINQLYPILIFKNNESNYINSDLKFKISYIYTNNNENKNQFSESFSYEDLLNYSEINMNGTTKVEIFVDFLYKNNTPPKDNLEIKINFNKQFKQYSISDEEEQEEKKSGSSSSAAVGTSIPIGTSILIFVVICIYKNCCKNKCDSISVS